MDNAALISLVGIIIMGLIYFATIGYVKKKDTEDVERQAVRQLEAYRGARIEQVFNNYMGFRAGSKDKGLSALLKSGVSTLNDDGEIQEVIELILAHGESHPLASKPEKLTAFDGVNLKIMFDYMTVNNLTFNDINHIEAIERSGAKTNLKP